LPDLLSLPAALKYFIIRTRYGSTFQLRYFPLGSLSFEPLGTTLIMHRVLSRVKGKIRISSTNFSCVFKEIARGARGIRVDKTDSA
jgi:hypothetical protein